MPLADARAMFPKINVAEADEHADHLLLEAIGDWCDRYTPLVGRDAPDGLLLDITGCAHLFGGEAALARDLATRLAARGLQTRMAVAGTVGCAWAVARHRRSGGIIRSGAERETIASSSSPPCGSMAMLITTLAQVGLKRIADILERPRAPLAARFGETFCAGSIRRWGSRTSRSRRASPSRRPSPSSAFAEPIARESDVLGTIEKLAARLAHVLEQRGEGARLLQTVLFRADGKVFRVEAGTATPLREPKRIARLFAERLDVIGDEVDPGFGYDMVRLCALVTERSDPHQTGLATPEYEADLAHLIDRLGARFGLRRVTRLIEQDTHIPEFAVWRSRLIWCGHAPRVPGAAQRERSEVVRCRTGTPVSCWR